MSVVFGFEHRHEMQVEPAAIAMSGFAHYPLVFESQALIEVARAGVVFEDVEEEAMSVEFAESDADDFGENAATRALAGCSDNDALQLDGAGIFAKAAEDHVGIDAGSGLVDVVASVGTGEGGAMAVFAPLANILAGNWIALERHDGGHIGGVGEAKGHGDKWILANGASRRFTRGLGNTKVRCRMDRSRDERHVGCMVR